MILFNPNKVSFGRHETFPLRFGWLTKGYRALCDNPGIFGEEDPTVILGVGKNMVSAIRYWLIAAQIVKSVSSHVLELTLLGSYIFSFSDGKDPYLEDDASLWLIHWMIASNPEDATTFYWFFNRYHKPEFTSSEALSALKDFAQENVHTKASETTLKHDITVLLRMYEPSIEPRGVPLEEGLDSPLSYLGLIQRGTDGKYHLSRPAERRRLPLVAFGFAVTELFEATELSSLPVEVLLRGDNRFAAPGSVFRLTEDGLITKLEELVKWLPGIYELRETAGIHQLYRIQKISKFDLLSKYYDRIVKVEAA
jgi:hypothetical protein